MYFPTMFISELINMLQSSTITKIPFPRHM